MAFLPDEKLLANEESQFVRRAVCMENSEFMLLVSDLFLLLKNADINYILDSGYP